MIKVKNANANAKKKKVTPQFSKFANGKARRNIIWGVYLGIHSIFFLNLSMKKSVPPLKPIVL